MSVVLEQEQSRILIIDDNAASIRLLSGMLKDVGRVFFATSGKAGIEMAREQQPHLILLDVEMPVLNGYEVCRLLKEDSETERASIIIVTAHSSMESEIQALEAGAVDFITKPLSHPVVRARVQSQLKLQHQATALQRLANRDGLTGLFNRRYFDQLIETEFLRHRRQNMSLGLALLDIDHFKAFNDGYGHLEGDACLKKITETLEAGQKRPGEVVARFGGEEFVVLFPHTTLDEASKSAAWLCQAISDLQYPHQFASGSHVVTISVGVSALIPDEANSVRQLIECTDKALYQAKSAGRNRVIPIPA
ncbi:diguanylate cyclase (GGDEF)-like protein [Herbaspirillum sp. Sphag1AN]|uniref:GGDEF domain-containing response regulator n=1 Tax=unclassified Herbaspirillum TaxID=2624150 RepID=UPI001615AD55|nr:MULTISPECIES: diguanylate cyclase [unclassified Herbaspirillum]MBB3212211.1 diguanylate cyclase (GGDEF)-like protein [Herbaspirillum sp. Sphag1AN]MBB3245691.1 diguanylate cyclase (GGDEF)-like protein [Herbaspirillum sp. Sphag64]